MAKRKQAKEAVEQREVSFTVSKREREAIVEIARRAKSIALKHGGDYSMMDAEMDVTATHSNGNPLRLFDLMAADDFNFTHDVFGIRRHLNRETGQLEDFFRPRYSEPRA